MALRFLDTNTCYLWGGYSLAFGVGSDAYPVRYPYTRAVWVKVDTGVTNGRFYGVDAANFTANSYQQAWDSDLSSNAYIYTSDLNSTLLGTVGAQPADEYCLVVMEVLNDVDPFYIRIGRVGVGWSVASKATGLGAWNQGDTLIDFSVGFNKIKGASGSEANLCKGITIDRVGVWNGVLDSTQLDSLLNGAHFDTIDTATEVLLRYHGKAALSRDAWLVDDTGYNVDLQFTDGITGAEQTDPDNPDVGTVVPVYVNDPAPGFGGTVPTLSNLTLTPGYTTINGTVSTSIADGTVYVAMYAASGLRTHAEIVAGTGAVDFSNVAVTGGTITLPELTGVQGTTYYYWVTQVAADLSEAAPITDTTATLFNYVNIAALTNISDSTAWANKTGIQYLVMNVGVGGTANDITIENAGINATTDANGDAVIPVGLTFNNGDEVFVVGIKPAVSTILDIDTEFFTAIGTVI